MSANPKGTMDAFTNFLRADTSKEEKTNLTKEARELQSKSPDVPADARISIYTTTSLQYVPKKEAKSKGFAGIAIAVLRRCKGKIELSISTALPEGVVVLVDIKSASEMRYELKLVEPSNAASLKITDCKTAVTVHTVPCRLAELVKILVAQTTPPPSPPLQNTPLSRVQGHTAPIRARRNSSSSAARLGWNWRSFAPSAGTFKIATALAFIVFVLTYGMYPARRASRAELFEAFIAQVAAGNPARLPHSSTLQDANRFLVGAYNQALHDAKSVIERTTEVQVGHGSLVTGLLGRQLAFYGRPLVRSPARTENNLSYFGKNEAQDLLHLSSLASKFVTKSKTLTGNLVDVYAIYEDVKVLCSWFSGRWVDACKHAMSD